MRATRKRWRKEGQETPHQPNVEYPCTLLASCRDAVTCPEIAGFLVNTAAEAGMLRRHGWQETRHGEAARRSAPVQGCAIASRRAQRFDGECVKAMEGCAARRAGSNQPAPIFIVRRTSTKKQTVRKQPRSLQWPLPCQRRDRRGVASGGGAAFQRSGRRNRHAVCSRGYSTCRSLRRSSRSCHLKLFTGSFRRMDWRIAASSSRWQRRGN